jgi:predicted tellurium resistance membrane protein TerC
MFEWVNDPASWAALATLTAMEVILGIDNVIFISVLVSRLPKEQADKARTIGLALAFLFRIALLFTLTWMIGLVEPVFELFGRGYSWRDIILFVGGAFLLAKATHEIHQSMEEDELADTEAAAPKFFFAAILQIAVVDLVFSIDSIITAIGMADQLGIMVAAVVIAMIVMYVSSGPVSRFIADHPTTKMLALAFLILIGASLCAEATGFHLPRGYIYAAMAFSAAVETINIISAKKKKKRKKVSGSH